MSQQEVHKMYGNRLRCRVCGILLRDDQILMVRHRSVSQSKKYFWAPPGGGIEFGSNAEENLVREFYEECGLEVRVRRFLFVHEFLQPPLHALELFFEVEALSGNLTTGQDPEMHADRQIIDRVAFMTMKELQAEKNAQLHRLFEHCKQPEEILSRSGYLKFENKSLN